MDVQAALDECCEQLGAPFPQLSRVPSRIELSAESLSGTGKRAAPEIGHLRALEQAGYSKKGERGSPRARTSPARVYERR